jgi:Na+/proline symporter
VTLDEWTSLAIYLGGMPVVLGGLGWYWGREERKAAEDGIEYYKPDPNAVALMAIFVCLFWPVFLVASPLLLVAFGIGWLGAAIMQFGERLGRSPLPTPPAHDKGEPQP